MYVVVVEFITRPAHTAAFVERVRQQALDTLSNEAGCHVFDVCLDPARENFVLLYEVYNSREAFELHLRSDHFRDFDATVRDWIEDKQVFTYERLQPN